MKFENIKKLEKLGRILIVELRNDENKHEIGKYLLKKYKVDTVILRKKIVGTTRRPVVEILAGKKNTETIYKENGCLYKMDVSKVMFSLGNAFERKRMASISNPSEVVLDMFAGIGQFTIQIAKHSKPRKVIAVDINLDAFKYLKENIILNKLNNVLALNIDNRELPVKKFASRVIMGWLFNTYEFIPHAIRYLKNEGIIHYHTLIREKNEREEIERLYYVLSHYSKDFEIVYKRIVKSYAPRVNHWVFDIYIKV